jgi:hypothetical protein
MSPGTIPARFVRLWYFHLLFVSDHNNGIRGPENERDTILETLETHQPIIEPNIPEDLKRGSDLCSRPTEFRARTPALIPRPSLNKIIPYLIAFTSLRI